MAVIPYNNKILANIGTVFKNTLEFNLRKLTNEFQEVIKLRITVKLPFQVRTDWTQRQNKEKCFLTYYGDNKKCMQKQARKQRDRKKIVTKILKFLRKTLDKKE